MEYDLILFDNLQEISAQAEKLGLQNIIIAKTFRTKEEIKKLKDDLKKSALESDIKICHLMQKTDNRELESYRSLVDFMGIIGDSLKNISFAASNKKFDFILLEFDKNLQMNIDKETLTNAKTNEVGILLPISAILNSNSYNKAAIMQKYAAVINLCKRTGCKFEIVSWASGKEEMRNKNDLGIMIELFK